MPAPRAWLAAAAAVPLLALPCGDATAQPAAAPTGPELSVSAAVFAPLAELTSSAIFATELSTAIGAAGTASWWFGRELGLALQGVWAPAELNARPSEFTGPIPTGLGDAEYMAGTAALTYRPATDGSLGVVEPFVGLGAGLRRLSVEPVASPDVEDATDPVGTVLAGVATRVWPSLAVRLELRDLVSAYESPLDDERRVQNDLLVSVGVSFRP